MNKPLRKTGIWLIGAYGDIATTLIVGCLAIRKKLVSDTGLVTQSAPINQLDFANLDQFVIGGHDVIASSVVEQACRISQNSRTFSSVLLDQIKPELETINSRIVVDSDFYWDIHQANPNAPNLQTLSEKLKRLISGFVAQHELDHVVIVNLTSAEKSIALSASHDDLAAFRELIAANRKDQVSPSMLYAYAGFSENCSHVNFTPNAGSALKALEDLAEQRGLPHCGKDGKTGETLLKTVLAPMFAARHLHVLSWEGINLLGNADGKTLNDPERCASKLQNKATVLPGILGYPLHSGVTINYVPSLGDWKTAWDFIHFQGFMDVPMQMQFTWQGCDSILAAPLVLDLIRLTEFAYRNGERGQLPHLACFFKNPSGVAEHVFHKQFEMLLDYTHHHLERRA